LTDTSSICKYVRVYGSLLNGVENSVWWLVVVYGSLLNGVMFGVWLVLPVYVGVLHWCTEWCNVWCMVGTAGVWMCTALVY
jgi:hypothetical protein